MSLALIAISEESAAIVTDGALTGVWADGATSRFRNDCPKFRAIRNGLVVAATGASADLIEHMYRQLRGFAADRPALTVDALCAFLSANLPHWHRGRGMPPGYRESMALAEKALAGNTGTSVAIVGYDRTTGRTRLISFASESDFVAIEDAVLLAIGVGVPDAQRLIEAWSPAMTWADVPDALVQVVREVSTIQPHVGGKVYGCTINGRTTEAFDFAGGAVTTAALGGNVWRLTRPDWNGPSGRVTFNVTAPGRETVVVGVTVPPVALGTVNKQLTISNAAFTPTVSGAFTNDNSRLTSGAGAGVNQTFLAFVPLPQGVTITGISMVSKCATGATPDNVLTLWRQTATGVVASTLITTATRTATGFDLGGVDSSATITELVTSRTYCLLLQISGDTNHEFYNATVNYTSSGPDKTV